VPYRGTPEMMADIIAGRVDFGFVSTVSAIGAINDGKLIALACGAEQRSSLLPDVPDCAGPIPGTFQLWPHRHGTDAMFGALLRRVAG